MKNEPNDIVPSTEDLHRDEETGIDTELPHSRVEEIDRSDTPVADLARELPPEAKDAVRVEGTWAPDGDQNDADRAQEITDHFDEEV